MQERRLHPRFPVSWAARLGRGEGAWFDAEASDISIAGLGLSVSRDAVIALAQDGGLLTPGDTIEIRFVGGDGGPQTPLVYECLVRQVRRISQDRYVVGGLFVAMARQQEQALLDAIAAVHKPRS
ncbi:MAG: PilZ domain-containing protein [Gammaproteobacteria bacterium]|nr:PilZ domain-containing protein [Gammaproteobacteria bacterium]